MYFACTLPSSTESDKEVLYPTFHMLYRRLQELLQQRILHEYVPLALLLASHGSTIPCMAGTLPFERNKSLVPRAQRYFQLRQAPTADAKAPAGLETYSVVRKLCNQTRLRCRRSRKWFTQDIAVVVPVRKISKVL